MKFTTSIYAGIATIVCLGFGSIGASAADNTAGLSAKDKQFITKAAEAGHAEVAAGNLASSKSGNDQIKKFGQQMVQDHGKAGDELKQIAQSKGVSVPTQPDGAHKSLAKKLEAAKASDFDRLYINEAGVKDHEAAVALFTDQAKNGKDTELKAFAEKTLPTIKEHYQMAQDLARTSNKK